MTGLPPRTRLGEARKQLAITQTALNGDNPDVSVTLDQLVEDLDEVLATIDEDGDG